MIGAPMVVCWRDRRMEGERVFTSSPKEELTTARTPAAPAMETAVLPATLFVNVTRRPPDDVAGAIAFDEPTRFTAVLPAPPVFVYVTRSPPEDEAGMAEPLLAMSVMYPEEISTLFVPASVMSPLLMPIALESVIIPELIDGALESVISPLLMPIALDSVMMPLEMEGALESVTVPLERESACVLSTFRPRSVVPVTMPPAAVEAAMYPKTIFETLPRLPMSIMLDREIIPLLIEMADDSVTVPEDSAVGVRETDSAPDVVTTATALEASFPRIIRSRFSVSAPTVTVAASSWSPEVVAVYGNWISESATRSFLG